MIFQTDAALSIERVMCHFAEGRVQTGEAASRWVRRALRLVPIA